MKGQNNASTLSRWAKTFLVIVVALSFVASSSGLALAAPPGDGIEGLKSAMITLATAVLSLLMIAASILLSLGIATGAVSGMFGATTGSPYVLAQSWFKIISIILLAAIAFASPLIAGTVINTMAGLGGGSIPLFGG